MMQNLSDLYPGHYHDCIYDALRYLPNALCVDLGAADGKTAQRIRAAAPQMRLVGFEPFPGNHGFFQAAFAGDSSVLLETLAVSDKVGEATFVVPQVVEGWEPGWENRAGYSSRGFLAAARSPSNYLQRLRKGGVRKALSLLARRERPKVLTVPTTTLDTYFGQDEIDFCKIDTQGAEYQVLAGARNLLQAGKIGVLYIEFEDNADRRILQALVDAGYSVFGTVFVLYGIPAVPLKELGLEILNELKLSDGNSAFEARLVLGNDMDRCIERLMQTGIRFHNDLIAVSPRHGERFGQAIAQLAASGGGHGA